MAINSTALSSIKTLHLNNPNPHLLPSKSQSTKICFCKTNPFNNKNTLIANSQNKEAIFAISQNNAPIVSPSSVERSRKLNPIAVIDNYDSFTYNLCQYMGELGCNFVVYRNDELPVDELKKKNPRGILISPGPGAPQDSGISLQTVLELGPTVPLFGVCMGLQCIGEAFGGKIVRSPFGVMHGKKSPVYYNEGEEDGLFSGLSNPFTAGRYHSLVIEKESFPHDSLEITAWTEDGLVMAARHKKFRHIQGVQFHPESIITTEEIDMMKERYAKLLLGEDMSGGGKGVCTALAISNAITNLSATVFGELWRLEPLAPQKKAMWCREMDFLLCISNSIVELVPSVQQFPAGHGAYEVMTTRPRTDLYMNLPALKKLDAMLFGILDEFRETEFWYVDRGILRGEGDNVSAYSSTLLGGRPSVRQEEKWWLPCPKVPREGLSDEGRKKIQQYRDCLNQILKAALAINSNVLKEMEIPNAYLETLPKSGKACLGEIIYQYITAELFLPERLLDFLNLSSEHQTMEILNRIEAAFHVWKLKDRKKHSNHQKSKHKSLGSKMKGLVGDGEKNHFLAQRAEILLHSMRIRFPSLPQTALDMNKIQYNKDVGQAILESYSRVMESLAFNIMARIDDVLFVDDATKKCAAETVSFFSRGGLGGLPAQKRMSPSPFSVRHTPHASPFANPPTFSSSPPLSKSPEKSVQINKPENLMADDLDKLWSLYAGNVSSRRIMSDVPERD